MVCTSGAHFLREFAKSQLARFYEIGIRQREARLNSAYAGSRQIIFYLLVFQRMRRVVRYYAIYRTVLQAPDYGVYVPLFSYRGVDFRIRIVRSYDVVREYEIMRASFGRYLYAARLCASYEFYAAVRRNVADVHGNIEALGESYFRASTPRASCPSNP